MRKGFCEYWLKKIFILGSSTSSIAPGRYRLCAKVFEIALKQLIPSPPKKDQQLVASGPVPAPELVIIPKPEYEWIVTSMVPQLPKFAPFLFSSMNIKQETDKLVAVICKRVGQKFVGELIVPEFLTAIDKGENDGRQMTTTLFLSAVAPLCDAVTFLTQARNIVTYATNELRGFGSRDIQEYIAPAFALLAAREPEKRTLLFKLTEELSKSSLASIRLSAVAVLAEIIQALDENEIEKNVLPVVSRLSSDPDESLLLEVVNCVGVIARFSSSENILGSVKEMFDEWLNGKVEVRLQTLRVFSVIIGDVDMDFRDVYILPKLLSAATDLSSLEDTGSRDQGLVIIMNMIYSLSDVSDNAVAQVIAPLGEILGSCEACSSDPKLEELKSRYKLQQA